jgi:hypothetical protein
MPRTSLIIAAVAILVVGLVVFLAYRLTRRHKPGAFDMKPMTPGFRSKRGRGR